ncbi:MAG TPA: CDF family Co(II)/Ni(II) efflux transporter DmeF [Alphaproteobacteria bacterium]|jgi:cation diffusion facilitator family transporter
MHAHRTNTLDAWQHDHRFGLHQRRAAEGRTKLVVLITLAMMVAEILAGLAFGSMALLADGLHMGSHALALGISALAYVWMRRRAGDEGFSFGTGKIAALGGYTGALLLMVPVGLMVWESVGKLVSPVSIDFGPALVVAVVGLAVNAVCAFILAHEGHDHGHEHDHHDHGHRHGHADHGEDLNLRSALLHVVADALTSVLAIAALLGGSYFGLLWLDPLMGLVGAAVIIVWAKGLIGGSGHVLLDRTAPQAVRDGLRQAIESDSDNRLADLHVWSIGPGIYAAALSLLTHHPQAPERYKALVPKALGIRHITVEVHRYPGADAA